MNPPAQTYKTLQQLFRGMPMAYMAEPLIRERFPSRFPCDVLWFFDDTLVSVLSLDFEERSGWITTKYRIFAMPRRWQRFTVGVV